MKKSMFLITFLLVFFACEKKENPLTGQAAFDFELLNINDQTIKLSDFRDQRIMLHFWADWCASCREEFYTLQNVFESIKNNNATVIGVNVGQSKEHIKELIDEYDITFAMLRDENKTITEKYHVVGLPMNYFVDKSGKIYRVVTGWMDKDKILEIFDKMEK